MTFWAPAATMAHGQRKGSDPGHKKQCLYLLLGFLALYFMVRPAVYKLVDFRANARGKASFDTLRKWVEQALICRSEWAPLCWNLRRTIDAGFKGDLEVMARHISRRLEEDPPPAGGDRAGTRGIVLSAGGQQYAANAFVNIYVLQRYLNCTLPVAMMYWGASHKDAISASTIAFMQEHLSNLQFIDASALDYPPHQRWLFPPGDDELFNGWKVKVFALYAAPFDEVLLLDGDSSPFQDLTSLFDHPSYREHGNLFWADPWCKPVRLFRKLGVADPWREGRTSLQTEAGQLLFNRRMHPDVLEWLLFLNTHEEVTYYYAYGDKDTYRAAFQLANKSEAYTLVPHMISVPLYKRRGRGGGDMLIQGLFHHHPDGRLLFLHRAGASVRKYDLRTDADHPISHLMLQPSCAYATKKGLQRPMISISGGNIITPSDCDYDLTNTTLARAACGLAPEGSGLEEGSLAPAVFEVSESSQVSLVQQQVDAAFRMLRKHLRADPTLFR